MSSSNPEFADIGSADELREKILSLDDIEDQLNIIEQIDNSLSGDDEVTRAILKGQQIQLMMMLQQGQFRGGIAPGDIGEELAEFGGRSLPIDALGIAAEDIQGGFSGNAVFFLDGGRFVAEVTPQQDVEQNDPVKVVGDGNRVDLAGSAGGVANLFGEGDPDTFLYEGKLRAPPRVITEDNDIKVENQLYVEEEYTTVDADLDAGEAKTFARINVESDEFILLKYSYASAAETVRYNYYIDSEQTPDEDLSGNTPLATPPDRREIIPNGFLLVDNDIRLELEETSGSNSYTGLTAGLEAIKQTI